MRTALVGGKVILERFETAQALASAAAEQWLEQLVGHASPTYFAALSGGRIAREFFGAVADGVRGKASALAKVHFFWSDERCVPPDDPESNFRLARELLFKPAGVSEQQIHRIKGELEPPAAARGAGEELCNVVAERKGNWPVLDMIFLGMGEDGHVASLFPPVQPLPGEQIYFPVVASKPPPNRITMSYDVLVAAKAVWVLASGAGKERALRDSLSGEAKTPLGEVIRRRQEAKLLTDIAFD